MAPEPMRVPEELKLPVGIVSAGDVRRLGRELEQVEDTLRQMRLRTNSPVAKLPRATRMLEEFAATNRLNLLLPADRERASSYISAELQNAPRLHMSFATEASRAFTSEIVLWLRSNIAPDVLLEIGLEPNIAAGCTLRTASKRYDFSLRSRFEQQSELLLSKLRLGRPAETAAVSSGESNVGQ